MRSLPFDSVVDNANSGVVVDVDGCWRLWMPKFVELGGGLWLLGR